MLASDMELRLSKVEGYSNLYDIYFYFLDTDRDMLEYFPSESFLDRIEHTSSEELVIQIRLDVGSVNLLSEYFNEETAYYIGEELLIYHKEQNA